MTGALELVDVVQFGVDAAFLETYLAEVGVTGGVQHTVTQVPAVQLAHLGLRQQRFGHATVQGVLDHPHDLRRAGRTEGDAAGEGGFHSGGLLAVGVHLSLRHRCRSHAQQGGKLRPGGAEGCRYLQAARLGLQRHRQPQGAAVHLLLVQEIQGRLDVLDPRVRARPRCRVGRLDALDHLQGDLAGIDLRAQPEQPWRSGQGAHQVSDLGELFVTDRGGYVGALDGLLVLSPCVRARVQAVDGPHAAVRRPDQVPGDMTDRNPHRAPPLCSARARSC